MRFLKTNDIFFENLLRPKVSPGVRDVGVVLPGGRGCH